jgi:methionine synthase II (cobalamin-independent)
MDGAVNGKISCCKDINVDMKSPTEPIGSIPRPASLIEAVLAAGDNSELELQPLYEEAVRDTINLFESTGSPVITDGEQRKYHNFWTYSVHGLPNTAPDGFRIPFTAGHIRRTHRLTGGPFKVGRFYIALTGEQDRDCVLRIVQQYMKPNHRIFVGVVSPIDPRIETPEEIRDKVLEAAEYIPAAQLGTTDDYGFSPFSDELSTSHDTAFAKIGSRIEGTELAARAMGGG